MRIRNDIFAGRKKQLLDGFIELLAVLAFFLIFTTVALPAQRGKLAVQNLSPYARIGWASVVVPFRQGEAPKSPQFWMYDRPTVWQPFGARWRDGSIRQALCFFPVYLPPFTEKHYTLSSKPGPYSKLDMSSVLGRAAPIEPLVLNVTTNGVTWKAEPKHVRVLELNAARRVDLWRTRVGKTGLVYEVITTGYTGTEYLELDIAVFFSDPTTKDMQRSIDKMWIKTKRTEVAFRHAQRMKVRHHQVGGGSEVTLLEKTHLADGQGIRRTGVWLPGGPRSSSGPDKSKGVDFLRRQTLLAARVCPIYGATSWIGANAFGPFGYVPRPGPWLNNRTAMIKASVERHKAFVKASVRPGDPFGNFGLGLAKYAGAMGGQSDFGIVKLTPVVSTGIPTFLMEVELSVLQEACRPVHYFEANGAPFKSKDHPNLVIWSGRPHWHCGQSKDRLGKPCPQPKFDAHGWSGKDRQHWSSNYLCGYYLLTGAHWARREIENEVQLYLSSQTLDPRKNTSKPGAPRAVGRCLMAAAWFHQCTGDADIVARMIERVRKVYLPLWPGQKFPRYNVRPMEIRSPDSRILKGKKKFWAPWQDSLAVIGLAAAWELTRAPEARVLAEELSETIVKFAWGHLTVGPRIGYAIAWHENGRPQPLHEHDLENIEWAGGGISTWSIGAVEVARQAAVRNGDHALRTAAEKILKGLRASRMAPRNGWFDEFGDWDAVR